jgi:hypothetical protein
LVTYVPFVWLPAILAMAALIGHILVWRKLAADRAARRQTRPAATDQQATKSSLKLCTWARTVGDLNSISRRAGFPTSSIAP